MNVTPAGQGPALPRGRDDSGPRVLVRRRAFAGRDLVTLAGLQRLSRHGLDARALPELRPREERDWGGCRCQALALTGDASGDRSGLPQVAVPCPHAAISRPSEASAEAPPPYVYRTIGGAPVRARRGRNRHEAWRRSRRLVLALGLGAAVAADARPIRGPALRRGRSWQATQPGERLNYAYARKSRWPTCSADRLRGHDRPHPRSGRRAGGAHRAREHVLAGTPPRPAGPFED